MTTARICIHGMVMKTVTPSRGSARMPIAPKKIPQAVPISAPVTEMNNASRASMDFICLLVRPRARSRPFSRVRSATDSDRVFATPTSATRTDTPSRPTTMSSILLMMSVYISRSIAEPPTDRPVSIFSRFFWTAVAEAPSLSLTIIPVIGALGAIFSRFA